MLAPSQTGVLCRPPWWPVLSPCPMRDRRSGNASSKTLMSSKHSTAQRKPGSKACPREALRSAGQGSGEAQPETLRGQESPEEVWSRNRRPVKEPSLHRDHKRCPVPGRPGQLVSGPKENVVAFLLSSFERTRKGTVCSV